MPTEIELTLEQTQQGVSYEVSVDPYGFEGYLKMEVEIRRLDCKTQYDVLIRRIDTSYPTGGYGVSAGKLKDNTLTGKVPGQDVTLRYLHGYGVCRQSEYAVLGIGKTRFLVKSWCRYAISLELDAAYW
ncbi:hypothetical protein Tco_0009077 [Tanacetum coccineum]